MADDTLGRLADRIAIEEVLIAYGRALDEVDLDLLEGLFTADCVVSYGPEPRLNHKGAAEVAAALARMWRFEASSHHISNVVIAFDGGGDRDDDGGRDAGSGNGDVSRDGDGQAGGGDGRRTARASSYVLAWHRLPGGEETIVYGQYRDRLVNAGGRWRIAERRMLMNGGSGAFRVALHRLERRPQPAGLDLAAITPAGDAGKQP